MKTEQLFDCPHDIEMQAYYDKSRTIAAPLTKTLMRALSPALINDTE